MAASIHALYHRLFFNSQSGRSGGEVIWVSPAKIVFYTETELAKSKGIFTGGHVWGGNWDLKLQPIVRHPTYRGLCEHFVRGVEWENTSLFGTPGFAYL